MCPLLSYRCWRVSFSLFGGGVISYEANQFARAERGEGVIARWTVDPASWRNYLTLRRTLEAQQILSKIEEALYDLDGRPHWGQWHWMTATKAKKSYRRYDAFREVYLQFNRNGIFSNSFTDRVMGRSAS